MMQKMRSNAAGHEEMQMAFAESDVSLQNSVLSGVPGFEA